MAQSPYGLWQVPAASCGIPYLWNDLLELNPLNEMLSYLCYLNYKILVVSEVFMCIKSVLSDKGECP